MTEDRHLLSLIEAVSGLEEKTKLIRLFQVALLLLSVWCLLQGLCNTADLHALEERLEETREYAHSLEEQIQNLETGGKTAGIIYCGG